MSAINPKKKAMYEVFTNLDLLKLISEKTGKGYTEIINKTRSLSKDFFNELHRKIHIRTVSESPYCLSMTHLDKEGNKDPDLIIEQAEKITPMERITHILLLKKTCPDIENLEEQIDYKGLLKSINRKAINNDEVLKKEMVDKFLLNKDGKILTKEDLESEENKEIVRNNVLKYIENKNNMDIKKSIINNGFRKKNEYIEIEADSNKYCFDVKQDITCIEAILFNYYRFPANYGSAGLCIDTKVKNTNIPPYLHRLIQKISSMKLSNIEIESLDEDFFLAFQKYSSGDTSKEIDLSYNRLTKIPPSIKFAKLYHLNLINNPIKELPAQMPKSITLSLSIELFKDIQAADTLFQTAINLVKNGTTIDLYLKNPDFNETTDDPENRDILLEEDDPIFETNQKFKYIFEQLQSI